MPFTNHPQHPIAIVGGGLGGLALAVGLIKRGINIHIYEAASAFSEIGAGVTSGVNAVRALQLIDDKLLEGYKKHVTFNRDEEKGEVFASLRWGCDERSGEEGGGLGKDGNGNGNVEKKKAGDHIWDIRDVWDPEKARRLGVKARSSIHRARLLEELVALLPQGITSFGKAFESVEELGDDGTLRLQFSDGTSAFASAIIGADGIKSRVRELVCGKDVKARYARECAYRAVVPRQDAIAALGEEGAGNGNIFCGYGGYAITYPIEHHELVNVVLMPHDLDDIDHHSRTVKMGNGIREENDGHEHEEWTIAIERQEMIKRFEGWYKPLIKVAAEFLMPQKWLLFDLRHDAPYYKGKICLLGDSAHATTPHLGAGAGQAMEDAYVLSDLIASVNGVDELEKAFRAYDSVRRPRTQGVVERSLQAALGYCLLLEGVGEDLDRLVEKVEDSFRWIWHEDLEEQLQRAKKLL